MKDKDKHEKCDVRFIFRTQLKVKYIFCVLTNSLNLKYLNPSLICYGFCEMVVNEVKKFQELCMYQNNPQYCHHFITPKTVMILFYQLRGNKESFLNITQRTSLIDKVLLISFQFIATRYFIPYTKSNVMGLTAEIMYNYFHDTTIPELVHEEEEIIGNTRTKNSILKQCKLTNLCIGTIYRWML